MIESDPYGSMGAPLVVTWEFRWMNWSLEDQEKYLTDVAHWGLLDVTQMAHLIQGFLPPTYEWLCFPACLLSFLPIVNRLKYDIEHGLQASALTPEEFVSWCDYRNVSLPEAFVREIKVIAASKLVAHEPTEPSESTQFTESIIVPAWAPIQTGNVTKPQECSPPKRGRPKTKETIHAAIIQEAKDMLMSSAGRGLYLPIPVIVKQLLAIHKTQGLTKDSLHRRLKGKLPIKQAKTTARLQPHLRPSEKPAAT